jgi:predicted DNA-binding protein (MmcQ/YjbR family)
MAQRPDVDPTIVERLAAICLALPEVHEQDAWVGTRWRVGTKTFAHVVAITGGYPPAYAEAARARDATVLTFRAGGDDLAALSAHGPPFFKPVWFRDIVGLVLGTGVDWGEVTELLTDSYCLLAPRRLAERVRERP